MKLGANRRDHDLTFHTLVPFMLPAACPSFGTFCRKGTKPVGLLEMMWKIVQTKLTALKVRVVVHKDDYPRRNAKTAETGIVQQLVFRILKPEMIQSPSITKPTNPSFK
jgi:hypothetical protein